MVPALSALLAAAAGCDPAGEDEPRTFGLASIQSAGVHVSHSPDQKIFVTLTATLARMEAEHGGCPPLAEDLAITVNDTPMELSLEAEGHGGGLFSFGCSIDELTASATLPVTGGPLRVELSQGPQTAVITTGDTSWPTIGPVSLSSPAAAVNDALAINVAISSAVAANALTSPSCWHAGICPREDPGCMAGGGGGGPLPITKITAHPQTGLAIEVQVLEYAPGPKWLTLGSYDCAVPVGATCVGVSCSAETRPYGWKDYAPVDFEVLE